MGTQSFVIDLAEIKKRTVSSFVSLTARQIALRAISFISLNIVLAKILPVETLGIFNIATAIVTFFAFFSDIGLAASLIQKKESVTKEDIATVFTLQQIIVGTLSLGLIISAGLIGSFYNLNQESVWLVRALGLSFFLSSLKVVPSVLLERHLRFQPLVVVEVVETLVFNILLIVLVFNNFNIWSFSIAVLSRGFTGTILLYLLVPTKLSLGINKAAARALLRFGLPYQLNSLLALLKDRLVPLVIAKMIGPEGVGYVTWSQALALLPLEIMYIVVRITFPAYSRMQDNKEALGKAVEKSLFLTSLMVYPALFGLGAILPSIVSFIVSSKWQPAVPAFYLFAFSTLWAVVSTTFTNTLNATGHIKTTLKLMVMWTALSWGLTPLFVFLFGFVGVGMASFVISFTAVLTIILTKRIIPVRVINAVWLPVLASAVMGVSIYFYSYYFVRNLPTLITAVILGGLIYTALLLSFAKERMLAEFKNLRHA